MKITTLLENTTLSPELVPEHGLSLFVETDRARFLFDAGQSGIFADNAAKLGVELKTADFAVLSHGHYDHGGGVLRFFKENERARLYVSEKAFMPYYNGTEKYIGLDPAIRESGRLMLTGEADVPLAPGLTIRKLDSSAREYPAFGQGLNVKRGEAFEPDDFAHEQYLEIAEGKKRVLISGCSHRGVLNIAKAFCPDVLVGGLHFMKLDPEGETLYQMGEALKGTHTVYYTGHCTGETQYEKLRERMGDQLHYLAAGSSIEL